ncbi:hypothetical protein ES708_03751 [subsurface metagenome]|jgi:hypothetical protein
MNITSMEIIRPSVAAIGVVAGEKIELTYGDTLKVNVSFDYRGLGETVTLFGAIGRSGIPGEELLDEGSFIKSLTGEQSIELPQSLEFTPVAASVDIPITTDISPGTNYDLYVKLVEYRKEAGMPEVDDVIDIPPIYELIQHTIYPYAYIYDGDIEVTTATFKTDPFTPAAWMVDKFADKLEEEVRARGGRPIEVKVYVDTTPLFWTNFRIEVVGTPLGAEVASGIAVGIPIWLAIILVCLAIIAVIVVATLAIKTVVGLFKTYPGLKDVKPGWGKETLMLTIHDSEEYWERPLTPTETLEGMSEAELRDHLDQIAEEEVAPEVAWWPLAVIGGVAVLGVGAVVALSVAKPKE